MKVIFFSTDHKIFDTESAVRARMISYAPLFTEFYIIVRTTHAAHERQQLAPNCWLIPAYGESVASSLWQMVPTAVMLINQHPQSNKSKTSGAEWILSAQDPFETGLMALITAKKTGARLHIQIHTDFLSPYYIRSSMINRLRVVLARYVLRRADAVRVVSERIRERMRAADIQTKQGPTVLPIYVDRAARTNTTSSVDLRQRYPQFSTIVLMASRITAEKNILDGIAAVGEAAKTVAGLGLVIVGEGAEKSALEQYVQSHHLNYVVFESWTTSIAGHLTSADAFLLTSQFEGYALTLLEAAAAGCSVVSTDVGIASELVGTDVCRVGDQTCLAQRLVQVLTDPTYRERQLAQARAYLNEQVSYTQQEYLERFRSDIARAAQS